MHVDKYPVIEDRNSLSFEFLSEGPNGKIEKKIVYTKTGKPNVFNLGFGDRRSLSADIDDLIVTNNGDAKKVLATVAATLYIFTDWYPNAVITAKGSTPARSRLYRMSISNNFDLIQADFQIFGLKNNKWQHFEKNTEYVAFAAKRKIINLPL
jgi:hypothetical protein